MEMTPASSDWYSRAKPPTLESPTWEKDISQSELAPRDKKIALDLARDGIAVFDPEIPNFDARADAMIEELKKADWSEGRLTNAWTFNSTVRDFALAPRVLQLLEACYGRKPIPYQTLNFNVGTEQPTHSDSMHFASVPSRFMAGVWVALEDTDETNGPLHYYPGSHRLPILTIEEMGIDKANLSINERYAVYVDYLAKVLKERGMKRSELCVKKGQAVIWAANVAHGGSPIRDRSRSRHSQVTHYFFEDCQYYAPVQSTVFMGKIQFLNFRDISTGKKITQEKPPWFNFHRLTSRHRVKKILSFFGGGGNA